MAYFALSAVEVVLKQQLPTTDSKITTSTTTQTKPSRGVQQSLLDAVANAVEAASIVLSCKDKTNDASLNQIATKIFICGCAASPEYLFPAIQVLEDRQSIHSLFSNSSSSIFLYYFSIFHHFPFSSILSVITIYSFLCSD